MFCQEYQIHKVLNMATHKKCLAANQWRAFLRAYRNNNVDRILRFSFCAISWQTTGKDYHWARCKVLGLYLSQFFTCRHFKVVSLKIPPFSIVQICVMITNTYIHHIYHQHSHWLFVWNIHHCLNVLRTSCISVCVCVCVCVCVINWYTQCTEYLLLSVYRYRCMLTH